MPMVWLTFKTSSLSQRHWGQTGENSADVNADGVVNIQDLVAVAAAFGDAAAAAPRASWVSIWKTYRHGQKWSSGCIKHCKRTLQTLSP